MYDPFDANNRDRRPRRKKVDVLQARLDYENGIINAFKSALHDCAYPDYFMSNCILDDAVKYYDIKCADVYCVLKRNMEKAMLKLNYVKIMNKHAKDGRFHLFERSVFVYKKVDTVDKDVSEIREIFS